MNIRAIRRLIALGLVLLLCGNLRCIAAPCGDTPLASR